MPTERTGSYPLMNLAADYGVDYGDVLLVMQHIRGDMLSRTPRKAQADAAAVRLMRRIGAVSYGRLVRDLAARL